MVSSKVSCTNFFVLQKAFDSANNTWFWKGFLRLQLSHKNSLEIYTTATLLDIITTMGSNSCNTAKISSTEFQLMPFTSFSVYLP
mmetsp:Transcript_16839/g.37894  ORF Transcript_16839/g.37894 Transcript_16839/m.37894 type:complete len:85 (+) Transcript_16839:236-490(+)